LAGKDETGDPIGIYAAHPRYGWSLVPGAVGRLEFIDFDVIATIDHDGFRVTDSPPKCAPVVLCLGCSSAFGHGVADDEAYPAILGRRYWPEYKVRNAAVSAWGTAQAYLFLEDYLADHEAPVLVLNGWVPCHVDRNYRDKGWLEFLARSGRKNAYFELENDRLSFRGLAGPEEGLPWSPTLRVTAADLSAHLLIGMEECCRQHGSRFVVVLLPGKYTSPEVDALTDRLTDGIAAEVCRKGVECIDLRQWIQGHGQDRLYFAHDPHPRPLWHELVAKSIAEAITLSPHPDR
jgi:hypothetical protein